MESYGEILQKTREEKNLDIDKIAREISIEKRFLVGLENEDYSAFPGEAYMVGFLRNYDGITKNLIVNKNPLPHGRGFFCRLWDYSRPSRYRWAVPEWTVI